MTVLVHIGRRVPRNWFKRVGRTAAGFISFQENIWIIIKQAMSLARRRANESGKIKFIITHEEEEEDLNYKIHWLKIVIQGTEEQEKEEYDDTMKLYLPLNKIFKKEMPKNEHMASHFKTKVLSGAKVEEAYKQGHGALNDGNVANKLLEMGILTHVEWVKDYNTREAFIPNS